MKITVIDKELFDGQEGNFVKFESILSINSDQIKISFSDFSKNDFRNLENSLTEVELEKLVKELDLRPFTFDGKVYYNDRRGIELYYCSKGEYLIIISFGETQPTRYKIFAVGAAVMDQNSNIS